jgi:intergrase/recombinase
MSGELFTSKGKRKYLTTDERDRFLKAAEKFDREVRTFCALLAYSGCRISEALALTVRGNLKLLKNGPFKNTHMQVAGVAFS